MSFHDVQFPTNLSFGSIGGPERRTDIVTLANGFEERNTPWAHARRRYDAGFGLRSLKDIDEIIAFYEARQGQLYGFRWKDWSDYKSAASDQDITYDDQVIAIGDGETTVFQLVKNYSSGGHNYVRPITKPVFGSVSVGIAQDELVEGVHWHLDYQSGLITFKRPPFEDAPVTAGYEFDVPVRFDTEALAVSIASFQVGDVPSIPVIEVRV